MKGARPRQRPLTADSADRWNSMHHFKTESCDPVQDNMDYMYMWGQDYVYLQRDLEFQDTKGNKETTENEEQAGMNNEVLELGDDRER